MTDSGRLARLEAAMGGYFPRDYRAFLESHRWMPGQPILVVGSNPEYWDVKTIFEAGDGPSYVQADEAYRLAADLLPAGFLPVAEDGGGNLYLMDCRDQPGAIFWWHHEYEATRESIEHVAGSFTAFLADLVPED